IMAIGLERKKSFEKAGVIVDSVLDLDDFDIVTSQHQQSQMFIWDSEKEKIVGGYRYSYNAYVPPEHSPMGKYFTFTDQFKQENWIHLGRSFLSIDYQQSRYGIVALMDGLGCLFAKAESPMGFFGKVTVPSCYETNGATSFVAAFCKHNWLERTDIGFVKSEYERKVSSIADFFMSQVAFNGNYKELLNLLKNEYDLPGIPILRMYESLSQDFRSIYYLGAFVHKDFGGSTEIGMAIA